MSWSDESETIGYGRPPQHTRFPKGQSGNPKGRPRRARDFGTLWLNRLNDAAPVSAGEGKRRRMSQGEAIVRELLEDALSGDPKATMTFFQMMRDYDEKYVEIDPDSDGPLFNFEEMEMRFGKAQKDFSDRN